MRLPRNMGKSAMLRVDNANIMEVNSLSRKKLSEIKDFFMKKDITLLVVKFVVKVILLGVIIDLIVKLVLAAVDMFIGIYGFFANLINGNFKIDLTQLLTVMSIILGCVIGVFLLFFFVWLGFLCLGPIISGISALMYRILRLISGPFELVYKKRKLNLEKYNNE